MLSSCSTVQREIVEVPSKIPPYPYLIIDFPIMPGGDLVTDPERSPFQQRMTEDGKHEVFMSLAYFFELIDYLVGIEDAYQHYKTWKVLQDYAWEKYKWEETKKSPP